MPAAAATFSAPEVQGQVVGEARLACIQVGHSRSGQVGSGTWTE